MSCIWTHTKSSFQSTPSAWRVTRQEIKAVMEAGAISIHTLRVEGDSVTNYDTRRPREFQSTPSAWRVTLSPPYTSTTTSYFNPHPPRGG